MNSTFFAAFMDELSKLGVMNKLIEPTLVEGAQQSPFASHQQGYKVESGKRRTTAKIRKVKVAKGRGRFFVGRK